MLIREVTPADWPAMWAFMRVIVGAGETFAWERDIAEDEARRRWCHGPPGRTVVAVDDGGAIAGTAETHPNQHGPGAHVANAGFMVNPAYTGRGVGRALGEHVLNEARADGYRAMQFNAVVETNAPAFALWRSLGFDVIGTVPAAFRHPAKGYVGLHIMHRRL
ncbi:MAG TPA: GNAT family N-acetyltransferase [Micromonosporaceae bacterium]|jgi:GNAT superfamily N-acetyltransferase